MFRKADPDHMLSSGTTYVRIIGAKTRRLNFQSTGFSLCVGPLKTLTAAERIELDPSPEPEMATLYEPATGRGRNLLGLNAALADSGH